MRQQETELSTAKTAETAAAALMKKKNNREDAEFRSFFFFSFQSAFGEKYPFFNSVSPLNTSKKERHKNQKECEMVCCWQNVPFKSSEQIPDWQLVPFVLLLSGPLDLRLHTNCCCHQDVVAVKSRSAPGWRSGVGSTAELFGGAQGWGSSGFYGVWGA